HPDADPHLPSHPPPISPSPGPDPGCTADLPQALSFTPETIEEASAQSTLTGCTDGSTTMVRNSDDSPVVWVVDRPDLTWTKTSPDLKVSLFRSTLAVKPGGAGLTIEPGVSARITAAPENIHLGLDPSVQLLWQYQSTVVDTTVDKAKELAPEILGKNRPWTRAAVSCGLAGYDVGSSLEQLGIFTNQDAMSLLVNVQSLSADAKGIVGSLEGCRQALSAADTQVERKTPGLSSIAVVRRGAQIGANPSTTEGFAASIGRSAIRLIPRIRP
ncbi:MAG: hypothetical protein L0H96_06040, partial [Humibacillus sp.]|nr:hypothetical protein [Humibacillus sp.]